MHREGVSFVKLRKALCLRVWYLLTSISSPFSAQNNQTPIRCWSSRANTRRPSMISTLEQAAHIFQATVRIARLIRAVSGCEGLNVVQSNGTVGQQDVFHFHVHLVPRVAGDTQQGRIVLDWDNTPRPSRELDRLAADLRQQLQAQNE